MVLSEKCWTARSSRVSDSADLGWGPIICISNRFLGAAAAAGARTTFWALLCSLSLLIKYYSKETNTQTHLFPLSRTQGIFTKTLLRERHDPVFHNHCIISDKQNRHGPCPQVLEASDFPKVPQLVVELVLRLCLPQNPALTSLCNEQH